MGVIGQITHFTDKKNDPPCTGLHTFRQCNLSGRTCLYCPAALIMPALLVFEKRPPPDEKLSLIDTDTATRVKKPAIGSDIERSEKVYSSGSNLLLSAAPLPEKHS